MVTVKAVTDKNYHSIKLRGHANYNPGNDIVCAACSSLMGALLGWADNNREHIKQIREKTDIKDMTRGKGNAVFAAVGDESLNAAFMTAVIGLASVAEAYPACVTVFLNGRKI